MQVTARMVVNSSASGRVYTPRMAWVGKNPKD